MRCPNCNKFVSLDFSEPEVENISVSDDGSVTAEVRIVRTCADCGDELKTASLSLEVQVDVGDHSGEGHELEVEEDALEQIEEGGGRYKKSYFGARVDFTVSCSCGKLSVSGGMEAKVAASGMDEMV
jgi:hypothetical protein